MALNPKQVHSISDPISYCSPLLCSRHTGCHIFLQLARQTFSSGSLHRLLPPHVNFIPVYPHGSSPLGLSLNVTFSVTPILTTLFITDALRSGLPNLFIFYFFPYDFFSSILFSLLFDFVYLMSPIKKKEAV